jgi:hypothetical protein
MTTAIFPLAGSFVHLSAEMLAIIAGAATNGVFVLYPQVVVSRFNPNGRWDFLGYSGPSNFGKQAPQVQVVREIETGCLDGDLSASRLEADLDPVQRQPLQRGGPCLPRCDW